MAHEVNATLPGYCAHLKQKIDSCFTRSDHIDSRKRFARRGITREIFEEHRVFKLFERLYFDKNDIVDASAKERLHLIAKKVRGDETSDSFCNALATLLYMRCTEDSLKLFADRLLDDRLPKVLADDGLLPLPEARLVEIFGKDEGHQFWEHQCLFRPVRLMSYDEAVYEDGSSPLPFDKEPELIGSGSFANVYKVKITAGHLIIDEANGSAYNSKYYAQKKFLDYQAEKKNSFKTESAILKKFIQSNKRHDNILVTKASLEWNGTYSLFFDLAKYNLWDYFQDERVLVTVENKASIFGRSIGLAGALDFLHEGLFLDSVNEQLHCYHLDLKPQNILVFERGKEHGRNGDEVWKISDFGISKIKHVASVGSDGQPGHSISFLDRIFRPQKSNADPSSGVDNSRYGGTYAAPEARLSTDKVTRKSDVWSLGCVLALLLTFLDDGSNGIKEFEKVRLQDRDNDRFFESNVPLLGTEVVDALHSSVETWLDRLVERANSRSKVEGTAVGKMSTYLQQKMLLALPEKRDTAKEVERKLMEIHNYFTTPVETNSGSTTVTPKKCLSQGKRSHADTITPVDINPVHLWHRLGDMVTPEKRHNTSQQSQEIWSFDVATNLKRCELSYSGKYLAIESDNTISTLLISDVREEQPAKIHETVKDAKWILSSLGSEYLCAVPNSEYFHCYYAALSSTDASSGGHLRTQIRISVRQVAMSPDDKITAFVLEKTRSGKRFLRLALFRTLDILESITQSENSINTLNDNLPWANIIVNRHESEIPATAGLIHLKFSEDSRTLVTITDAYKRKPDGPLHCDIMTWDMINGHRTSVSEVSVDDLIDMSNTIAPLNHTNSFASISKRRIGIYSTEVPRQRLHSQVLGADVVLFDLLVDEERKELIILGQSGPERKIELYNVSMSKVDGLASLGQGMDTGLTHSSNSKISCCWYRNSDDQRRSILVANVPTNGREGLLSVMHLD